VQNDYSALPGVFMAQARAPKFSGAGAHVGARLVQVRSVRARLICCYAMRLLIHEPCGICSTARIRGIILVGDCRARGVVAQKVCGGHMHKNCWSLGAWS